MSTKDACPRSDLSADRSATGIIEFKNLTGVPLEHLFVAFILIFDFIFLEGIEL